MTASATRSSSGSETALIRVSVTELVAFCCRQGDLHPAGQLAGPTAREGQRAHVRLQARLQAENDSLQTEVAFSTTIDVEGLLLQIGGRVDLHDVAANELGEIKTSLAPADELDSATIALHEAQLKVYGWLFLMDTESPAPVAWSDPIWQQLLVKREPPRLRLHYCNLLDGHIDSRDIPVSSAELHAFAKETLARYVAWMRRVLRHRDAFRNSAASLGFPHRTFRQGQRDLAAAVYRTLRDGGQLLVEAPTGIGKSISTLFPAVRILAEGQVKQVAWLTAKVAGRQSAIDALTLMHDKGLAANVAVVRAKRDSCFCRNGRCERDEHGRCPMTLGFFDRLPAARDELLDAGIIDSGVVDRVAEAHALCPFELSLQMLPWMQIVVCDYNYVFDPLVRLSHFDEKSGSIAVLIDEAHNFPERARSMYSAKLSRSLIESVRTEITALAERPLLARRLASLSRSLLEAGNDGGGSGSGSGVIDTAQGGGAGWPVAGEQASVLTSPPECIDRPLGRALETLVDAMADERPLPDSAIELFLQLARYRVIRDLYGDSRRTLISVDTRRRFRAVELALRSLDAAPECRRHLDRLRACVVFSATLSPAVFFRDRIGLGEDTRTLSLPSIFPPENVARFVVPWVNTRYRARRASLPGLVEIMHLVLTAKPGNYMVFFPSWRYLEEARQLFAERYPEIEIWQQQPGEDESTRRSRLEHLATFGHRLGFAIAGGGYAEGTDFSGDLLIGVIVVGTGLPAFDLENRLRFEHLQAAGEAAYEIVYLLPGMARVLQTTGRLIRNEHDRGVLVLIDDRYLGPDYRRHMPVEWRGAGVRNIAELRQRLARFWH
ncbi:MAG: hypothetical protein CSB44_06305 [Gammaproteobacteria bacterium]|nr:MAG: hypothetical protein CSB44_06305 [Gammaproteobacteria bacterium]